MDTAKQELQEIINKARESLGDIENAEWMQENIGKIGTFWKYCNSYSCPEKPSDYWWIYRRIKGIEEQRFITFDFCIDKDGKLAVEECKWSTLSGWMPCAEAEYRRAWKRIVRTIAEARP